MTINDKASEYFTQTLEPALDLTRLPELEALCVNDDNLEHHLQAAYGFLSEEPKLASVEVIVEQVKAGVAFGRALEKFIRDYQIERNLSVMSFGSGLTSAVKRTLFLGNGAMTRHIMAATLAAGCQQVAQASQLEGMVEQIGKDEDAGPMSKPFASMFGKSPDKKPKH